MTSLSPAPSVLGLSSPAVGPWFDASSAAPGDLAALPGPSIDLSVTRDLPAGAIWNAPAGGLLSFYVAQATRPAALSTLRQADGSLAFAEGALVVLFTLLPEVAARLGALSQAVPRPDATAAVSGDQRSRPVIAQLALEFPAAEITGIGDVVALLPDFDAADLRQTANGLASDVERAAYLGLSAIGALSNAPRPVTVLRRPEQDDRRLVENSGPDRQAKFWAFTRGGRAYDPGTVAAIWARLAMTDWDNLWAGTRQRTAAVDDARTVLLVNAHQGPLDATLKARVSGNLTNLISVDGSDVLFSADGTSAIGFSAAPADPNADSAPVPLIGALPAGPYADPGSATPFAGWADAGALQRDFQRIGILDVERQLVGLGRDAGTAQADPRRRIVAAQNSASPLFLADADKVATQVMARFAEPNSAVTFIAPELDRDYGPQPGATLGATDPFGDTFGDPVATALALKGSGTTVGNTAADQSIVLRFDGTLPPGAWIRAWPHGRDTTTGRRFHMTGGAALADGGGSALLVLPLPDGENGGGANAVAFSYDLSMTTTTGNRLLVDRRAGRPAVDTSAAAVDISALGGTQSLYCPETASQPAAAAGAIAPGHTLIVVNGAVADTDFVKLDMASLRDTDLSAALPNSADGTDRIVTNEPAFVETVAGDLPVTPVAGGPERVHEAGFHTGSVAQEIYDFAAHDATSNEGVIGAVMARTPWHEAPPAALGHPGVSAAPEIHGEGLGIAGPAADQLRLLMRQRRPATAMEFVERMGVPVTPAAAPAGAGPWTALLETAAKGTHGNTLISRLPASVNPGLTWDNPDPASPGIKQRIDAALDDISSGQTVDGQIDSANFDDDTASAAFDRLLDRNRNGAQDFARAATAAIGRAEDMIWLQTPALDAEVWTDPAGNIEFLKAITERLTGNQALRVVLVLPEKHIPKRLPRIDTIRKAAVGQALEVLNGAAQDRVAWVAPVGGPGRAFHMSSTTLVVDDAVLFSGAAHGWRRGLVFDSALTGAVFDARLRLGRPQEVITARQTLASALLGLPVNLVPETGPELVAALKAQSQGGGFGRSNPSAYTPKADPTPEPDREIWNPSPNKADDWQAVIGTLVAGPLKTDFENGTR